MVNAACCLVKVDDKNGQEPAKCCGGTPLALDEQSEVREERGDGARRFGEVEGKRGAQVYWKYTEHRSRPRRSQNGGILASCLGADEGPQLLDPHALLGRSQKQILHL